MSTTLNFDDEALTELLCYLVVAELVAMARSGEWLRTDHLVESARIWLKANGATCEWQERVRLARVAAELLPPCSLRLHLRRSSHWCPCFPTDGCSIIGRRSCAIYTNCAPIAYVKREPPPEARALLGITTCCNVHFGAVNYWSLNYLRNLRRFRARTERNRPLTCWARVWPHHHDVDQGSRASPYVGYGEVYGARIATSDCTTQRCSPWSARC